jgi:hypothetical protein
MGMARRLVLIPYPSERVVGATRIEPGYPRQYTPDEMRGWANDLKRSYATSPDELQRLGSAPPQLLTDEQRRILDVHNHLFNDASTGIKGSLRPDGRVELDGGRHRAGYLLEQGINPMPVWVSAPDQRQLDDFTSRCQEDLARQQLAARSTLATSQSAARTPPVAEREPPVTNDRNPGPERDANLREL